MRFGQPGLLQIQHVHLHLLLFPWRHQLRLQQYSWGGVLAYLDIFTIAEIHPGLNSLGGAVGLPHLA